jgi:glycosyltransferase involved in cell wall biosynthesis
MVIGIDASRANKTQKTGTEWYSWQLIQELKKIPPTQVGGVKFVLYSPNKLKGALAELPEGWKSQVFSWPPKYLWTQLRFSCQIKKFPPDLLFVPAHVIPRAHPQKTVTVCHDIGFKRFPGAYSAWSRFYLNWSTRFALKHASKIIAISEFTKNELINIYQADSSKIEVVHLAYNDQLFRPIKDETKINEVLAKYKIEKPYILYVGRLEEKKNIVGLLKAFKLFTEVGFSNIKLVLVGKPGYGYRNFKRQKSKVKNILEIGYLEQTDLPYLYSGAKVFVFPSFYEGFGMPVLEAMACATPVVASSTTSIPEVAGDAALLVNPDNSKEIAAAVEQIINDTDLRTRLVQKGLDRVKNFSWQKCARETLELLLNC